MHLTRDHFNQALTARQLCEIIIIRIALMLGMILYFSVVVFLYNIFIPDGFSEQDVQLMNVLSIGHTLLTLTAAPLAFYLSNLQLRRECLSEQTYIKTPEEAASYSVGLYRKSSIILMTPIAAAAFFGAVTCMIGVQNGTIEFYPLYWLNAASAVLLIMTGIAAFPTREKALKALESAFGQP
ncbi:MAG: hypothetical protein JXA06_02060 [Bacteroidetes bacterium]|nr:hypothetical protein [Bacteroidota bacterium]